MSVSAAAAVPTLDVERMAETEPTSNDSESRPSSAAASSARGRIADARSFAQKHLNAADSAAAAVDQEPEEAPPPNPYLSLLNKAP